MSVSVIKLDKKVEKFLKEIEEYSSTHDRIWSIPRAEGQYLYRLILKEIPKNILELGTSIGYSTIWLGLAAREIGAHVLSVDNDTNKVEAATQNIAQAGLSETVAVRLGDTAEIMRELKTEKRSFEFIFMDTEKDDYFRHFELTNEILKSGGLLAADNAVDLKDHMLDFLEYVERNLKLQTELVRIGNGVELVRKL